MFKDIKKLLVKAGASVMAFMLVFSSAAGVSGFRDPTRDITYVYEDIWWDMPIPDAYQYRTSIFLRSMLGDMNFTNARGEVEVRPVTLPVYMYVSPQDFWMYVVEMELNGVIVLDGNQDLVRFPNQNNWQMLSEFKVTREVFERTFRYMEPDELRSLDDIMARRNVFRGWQCICGCTCPPILTPETEPVVRDTSVVAVAGQATIGSRLFIETADLRTEVDENRAVTLRVTVEVPEIGRLEGEEEEPYEIIIEIPAVTDGSSFASETVMIREYESSASVDVTIDGGGRLYRVAIDTPYFGEGIHPIIRAIVSEYVYLTHITPVDCTGTDEQCFYTCLFRCGHRCDPDCLGEDDECLYGCSCEIHLICKIVPQDAVFTTTLRRPEGIYVSGDGTMYVADTNHNRVLIVTPEFIYNELTETWEGGDFFIDFLIYMPSSRELGGERLASFLPTAVVADTAGRITVVARNINNGMLQFSREGIFNRYIGAPAVNMDAWTRFLRRFQTEAQRSRGMSFVPTEFNNIRIDERNFIWGTISALQLVNIYAAIDDPTHNTTPIKRLNPLGDDILKRKGERGIWGDVDGFGAEMPSRIVDVGIGPAGVYTLLDASRGRMFTFNDEGIMLFAFGNIGTRKGNFRRPASIAYMGMNILVLDTELAEVVIFEPTLYGELIISAEQHFTDGNYHLAYDAWARAAEQNANFSHAFYGLGNARFNEGSFTEAMAYFMHSGGDSGRDGYSRSRDMLRRDQMDRMFPYISAAVIIGALALVGFLIFKGIRNYALSDDIIGYERNPDE
jgi:hypothetical protein